MPFEEAYDNWDQERESIIDDTLDSLRDQRDDQAESVFTGAFTVNPQFLVKGKVTVHGPIVFEEQFDTVPQIMFGEVAVTEPSVSTEPVTDVPFLTKAFVARYSYTNGKVEGFYLGLYALTDPPAGVITHSIDWLAKGKGSAYHQELLGESWSEEYDYNDADYLVEEAVNEDEF